MNPFPALLLIGLIASAIVSILIVKEYRRGNK